MPSASFNSFNGYLLSDVKKLVLSHGHLSHDGRGRRGLGHITRSGLFMLCAAWESYLEDLAIESAQVLVGRAESPKDLPKVVQKELVRYVKNHKHELRALDLAAEGWRQLYLTFVAEQAGGLNTPKATNVNSLFHKAIGAQDLSSIWTCGVEAINTFVADRGGIAHRGADSPYVTIVKLNSTIDTISQTVRETDNYIAEYLRDNSNGARLPWNRRH